MRVELVDGSTSSDQRTNNVNMTFASSQGQRRIVLKS
jgi:hypothetical protein